MSTNWEVDPETRSKLQEISKTNENGRCVDCGAPSPQWASPKFGIFFCLACSGIHRSLGVHISFVRSVSMDAFKLGEVKRMELGGNRPWKDFFNAHSSNTLIGREFDSCTIAERYDSEAGEEWKDRLTSKVDGTEYVPGSSAKPAKKLPSSAAPSQMGSAGSGRNTPVSNVKGMPQRNASPSRKARNEAYFASKGEENASRPDHLPPSQGGKYGGFGSSHMPSSDSNSSVPSGDDFQRDPMAALTKGFGWLSSTVSKQAANVNKTYLQPGMKSLTDGELAAQARSVGMQAGNYVQQGARGMNNQFNKFVDPDSKPEKADFWDSFGEAPSSPPEEKKDFWNEFGQSPSGPPQEKQEFWNDFGQAPKGPPREKKDFWEDFGQAPAGPPQEKKDFWDDFAAAGHARAASVAKPTSIGTSAMKPSSGPGLGAKKEDENWSEW